MFKLKKVLATLVVLAMVFVTVGCSTDTKSSYDAGTYKAFAMGMKGDVNVEVTFTNDAIESIVLGEHQESPSISDAAFIQVPEQILASQSLGVDVVAGATITSNALIAAISDAVQQAGGDVEALKKVEVKQEEVSKELVEKQADVIVIGGGGAGLAAAVSAAQEGASVIVIEANDYLGGNTVRSAGAMSVADPETTSQNEMNEAQLNEIYALLEKESTDEKIIEWQSIVTKQLQEHLDANNTGVFDSIEFNCLQLYYRFGAVGDPVMIQDTTSNGLVAKNWLGELGLPWAPVSHTVVGDSWPRWVTSSEHKSGVAYIETFENAIKDLNLDVEIITALAGEELIQDETGKVIGVKAITTKGTPYQLNANKGVVIATGGFSANPEMMVEYGDGRWSDLENVKTTNDPSSLGDGITMALAVGAGVVDMAHVQILPIADPITGYTDTLVGASTNMYINSEGLRFVDESTDRDSLTNAILSQTNSEVFIISSSENAGIDADGMNIFGRNVQELVDQNSVIFKGETLEDLATQIGIDPKVLIETVEKFNLAVQTGNDEEFGRLTFGGDLGNLDGTPEILTGPFYACRRAPAAHITKGGLTADLDGKVLNTEGQAINGLYSAGEVNGGSALGGIVQAITDGYKVGKNIIQ